MLQINREYGHMRACACVMRPILGSGFYVVDRTTVNELLLVVEKMAMTWFDAGWDGVDASLPKIIGRIENDTV